LNVTHSSWINSRSEHVCRDRRNALLILSRVDSSCGQVSEPNDT